MSKKTPVTYEQQQILIAEAAVAWQEAETNRNNLKRELGNLYTMYFRANGEPYADQRRIDRDDPEFGPVLRFTEPAYRRYVEARKASTSAKRKLRQAIMALERAV